MNLNLTFYKENEEEISKEEKDFIETKLKNIDFEEDYRNIIKKESTLESILTLSEIRENILSWYPFRENSSILEIGANLGEVTGLFCQKAKRVVAIEESKTKAEIIAKRHQNEQNLEIIVGNLNDIKLEEKFDYIILIGYLENKRVNFKQVLNIAKSLLTENGTIFLALDNKLGMKYFSKTDSTGITIANPTSKQFISINKIYNYLKEIGFDNIKTYYPMPDYKLTNVIFTDQRPLSKNDLSRNVVYNGKDTIIFFDENTAYRELLDIKENISKNFVNSYLLEITNKEINNKIKFISFSNMRKHEYKIKTIMDDEYVYKYPANNESKKHIDETKENIDIIKESNLKTLDDYNENEIISKFSKEKTLDEIIIELFKNNQKDEAIELMKKFKDEIKQKLKPGSIENNVFDRYGIKYDKEDLLSMYFVKDGLWDLIFQNCFYINQEFYFYDQEWKEENLPIDFIMYRVVKYFGRLKKYISDEDLYNILEIDKGKIKLFDELDDKIQEKIRSEYMWELTKQGKNALELKIDILTLNHQINLLNIEKAKNEQQIVEKEQIIIQKDQEVQALKNQLNAIYNSTSWKITKPLRKIRELKDGNKFEE